MIDLTGKKFNYLTVIDRAENIGTAAAWNCKCECGNHTVVKGAYLRNGHIKSCGCKKGFQKGNNIAKTFHEKPFKYSIGDIVEPKENSKILIIDSEYRKEKSDKYRYFHRKYYKYECMICGNIDYVSEQSLNRGHGCNACANKKIMPNHENSIAIKAPWMSIYFQDKNDIYKYTPQSNKKIMPICPICNKKSTKQITISQIYRSNYICGECSLRRSFPERIMKNILDYNNISYEIDYEVKFRNQRLRIDFLLTEHNIAIETDGSLGHGNKSPWYTGENRVKSIERDLLKEEYLNKNKIKLIRIDCRNTSFNAILEQILNSELHHILKKELNKQKLYQDSIKNIDIEIINDYNKGLSKKELCIKYKFSDATINNIINKGCECGLCIKRGNNCYKKIICVNTGEIFDNAKEAALAYNIKYQQQIHYVCQCKTHYNTAGKHPETSEPLKWKYA